MVFRYIWQSVGGQWDTCGYAIKHLFTGTGEFKLVTILTIKRLFTARWEILVKTIYFALTRWDAWTCKLTDRNTLDTIKHLLVRARIIDSAAVLAEVEWWQSVLTITVKTSPLLHSASDTEADSGHRYQLEGTQAMPLNTWPSRHWRRSNLPPEQ